VCVCGLHSIQYRGPDEKQKEIRSHSAEKYLACGACGSFRAKRVLLTQLRAVGEMRPKQYLPQHCRLLVAYFIKLIKLNGVTTVRRGEAAASGRQAIKGSSTRRDTFPEN